MSPELTDKEHTNMKSHEVNCGKCGFSYWHPDEDRCPSCGNSSDWATDAVEVSTPANTPHSTEVVTLPLIHINGTSPETLCKDYASAADAVTDAIKALRRVDFSARDYVPLPNPCRYEKAAEQHHARLQSLYAVRRELLRIAEHVADHIKH
jgi:hypothetical protein